VENDSVDYELQTLAGRSAAARRAANAAAREFDRMIEAKLDEVRALMLLRRIFTSLPGELLRRQWIPALDDAGEVRWKPPPSWLPGT
jgi:hypothetical protein